MKVTPQQRIKAYNRLARLMAGDHNYFMRAIYSVAEQHAAGAVVIASSPQRNWDYYIKLASRINKLLPLIEKEVEQVLDEYATARNNVLDYLFREAEMLEVSRRQINESMQEVLSKISQAIVRNQNP